MKKVFLMTALAGMAALGAAQAQSWTVDGPFKDDLVGCSRISAGQVQCIIKSTYTGNTSTYQGATYFARDTAAYAPDQTRYIATVSSMNGRDVTNATVNATRGVPAVVAYTFNYPAQFDKISLLFIDGGMLKEVPVKGSVAAAAPRPQAAQSQTSQAQPTSSPAASASPQPSQGQPSQPARTPSAPPVTSINLGSIDIRLTDCKASPQGGYVCSRAEVTPRR